MTVSSWLQLSTIPGNGEFLKFFAIFIPCPGNGWRAGIRKIAGWAGGIADSFENHAGRVRSPLVLWIIQPAVGQASPAAPFRPSN
jgi:hypothetical protein